MEEINKYHTQQVETKKEYLAALSLPVKEVAEAMGDYQPRSSKVEEKSIANRSSLNLDSYTQSRTIDQGGLRLPNARVNEGKLKVILKQLKKIEREKANTARSNYWFFDGSNIYNDSCKKQDSQVSGKFSLTRGRRY